MTMDDDEERCLKATFSEIWSADLMTPGEDRIEEILLAHGRKI